MHEIGPRFRGGRADDRVLRPELWHGYITTRGITNFNFRVLDRDERCRLSIAMQHGDGVALLLPFWAFPP